MATLEANRRNNPSKNTSLRQDYWQYSALCHGAAVILVTIFPIYWMLVSTFQPNKYTLHYPPPLFP